MKILELFENQPYGKSEIEKVVRGIVVVGGYSGIAKESIKNLKESYQGLEIKQITNKL